MWGLEWQLRILPHFLNASHAANGLFGVVQQALGLLDVVVEFDGCHLALLVVLMARYRAGIVSEGISTFVGEGYNLTLLLFYAVSSA